MQHVSIGVLFRLAHLFSRKDGSFVSKFGADLLQVGWVSLGFALSHSSRDRCRVGRKSVVQSLLFGLIELRSLECLNCPVSRGSAQLVPCLTLSCEGALLRSATCQHRGSRLEERCFQSRWASARGLQSPRPKLRPTECVKGFPLKVSKPFKDLG